MTGKKRSTSFLELLRKNYLLVVIFVSATLLRVWSLRTHAIFFDDAGFDIWEGARAVSERKIPLLGIASSVPRFHQGPITVWIHMIINILFGQDLIFYSVAFVLISLLALVLLYEFCDRFVSARVALIVTTLVAFSPFAIAQARMPYHTNPIPLALVLYLWALVRLWQKKKRALFWAVLSWCFLFQFELNIFPILVLIPYVLWRTKNLRILKIGREWLEMGLAGVIGLLPQIIYDLGHKFSQLGLFVVWIGYRMVGAFLGKHQVGVSNFRGVLTGFFQYAGRIWTTDLLLIKVLFFGILIYGFYLMWRKIQKKKLIPAIEIVAVISLILSASYLVHGSPSEAYFPPFIILLPIIVGWVLGEIFSKRMAVLRVLLGVWALTNVWSIFNHNFFVSNSQSFSYGYSPQEQREILRFINQESGGDFRLDTTREMRKFKSTFTNLRWLGIEEKMSDGYCRGQIFYIEDKDSDLNLRRNKFLKKQVFPSVDVYFRPVSS